MIISQIIKLFRRQTQQIIPSPLLPLAILQDQINQKDSTGRPHHKNQAQADRVTRMIKRCLSRNVNIARNNTCRVSQSDLHRRPKATLIRAAHIIVNPGHNNGLRDEATGGDEIERHVADGDGNARGVEKDGIPDRGDDAAQHDEGVTVFHDIREDRHAD